MLPNTVSAADDRESRLRRRETNRVSKRKRESILSRLIVKKEQSEFQ